VAPKRCGHFDGQEVVPAAEMRQKIRAATESRRDDDTLIIARIDARSQHGLNEALDRAAAYADAGADVLVVEGQRSRAELAEAGAVVPCIPKLANMVEGGKTSLLPREELLALGYSIVLYANAAMQGAICGTQLVLSGLREFGSLDSVLDGLAPWRERQRLVGHAEFDDLQKRYQADEEAPSGGAPVDQADADALRT
jgi:2-methylisocitrate lyase-like PEP mutase family enzyme